ncbi:MULTISPECIES: hypothetical protein [Paenibacillus]|uniref:Uncharacterized protein n=1 Tax=Paenibacillus odorifer TaxID=189426 RepID=A0AB36JER9_9BACL|nr:hypothetical protein [Paenibacillus odorifer]OME16427.1 hypothetical protein BSK60_08865 [Paenibacillus odorifer]OME19524.1 hypothetical protein BSK47_15930 [Paenibacillus odorifer]
MGESVGAVNQKVQSEVKDTPEWKSLVSVREALGNIDPVYAEIVSEVLSLIGKKSVTYEAALYILERSKEALRKCTLLQDEYTP